MTTLRRSLILGGFVPAFLTLEFLTAGCSSDAGPGSGRRDGQAGHHGKPPIPMAGQATFFDGRIVAEVNVGASGLPDVQPADGSGAKGGGEGGGNGRHGGGSFGGGGGHRHGGGGGAPSEANSEGGGRRDSIRPLMGSMGPTQMIHLRFTNQGAVRVELGIDDFSSPFGNFAVQPEKLVLDPGQSLETEPMSSQLAGSLTETDATLVLRLAGQPEKKVIVLRAVPAAAKADGAGPPPGDVPLPVTATAEKPGK